MATQNKIFNNDPQMNEPRNLKKKASEPQADKYQEAEDQNQENGAEDDEMLHHIEMLEEHQRLCEKECRYVEAEIAKNKLLELKKQFEIQRREEIRQRHLNEKAQLEQEQIDEFKEFNGFWDEKMAEFNEQARTIEEQTMMKHQGEMQKFLEELDMSLPQRPKDSPELLNLRSIQQNLAKKKEYIEAHKIQQRCLKLEKEELERWIPIRNKKILNQKAQLEQKQANELNALRKRIATGQDEQRKARSLELERLLQKYQNVRKELENQQQLELLRISNNTKGMNATATGSLFKSQGSRVGRSTFETMGSPIDTMNRKK